MLEVRSLKLPHGPVVSLQLASGKLYTLSGPNGSGKSLLLRSLALLTRTEWAAIKLDGVAVESISPPVWRRRVLYVPPILLETAGTVAHYALSPWALAVRQGQTPELTAFEELRRLGLWERDVDKISSGEKQFIQLTRALALKPDVLLLDESLGQMDETRLVRAEELLTAFTAASGTVLLVTHDSRQVERAQGTGLSMGELSVAART